MRARATFASVQIIYTPVCDADDDDDEHAIDCARAWVRDAGEGVMCVMCVCVNASSAAGENHFQRSPAAARRIMCLSVSVVIKICGR